MTKSTQVKKQEPKSPLLHRVEYLFMVSDFNFCIYELCQWIIKLTPIFIESLEISHELKCEVLNTLGLAERMVGEHYIATAFYSILT